MKSFLRNSLCIVSGASSGIGRSLSRLLIEKYGCRVIGIARNEDKLVSLRESLSGSKERFSYRLGNVNDRDCWASLACELENEKAPVVLINNAGILLKFRDFGGYTEEDADLTLKTDFVSVTLAVRALLPLIIRTGGGIVNISSSAALAPLSGTSLYSAGKAAAKAFTEALRNEQHGRIYVGLVCPGFTKTPLLDAQNTKGRSSIVFRFASDCERTAKKISRGINAKKPRIVCGADAHIMDILYRLMPSASLRLFAFVMRKSGLEIFEDVFTGGKES